jgi:uncharacterized protein
MISPDVNVLVAASRSDHVHHSIAFRWLSEALADAANGQVVDILPVVATGYLRLVTHPKVFPKPTPLSKAVEFLDYLMDQRGVGMSDAGLAEWRQCRQFCLDKNLSANDVSDSFIAGSVRVMGATLVTFDRGFARFLSPGELQLLPAA